MPRHRTWAELRDEHLATEEARQSYEEERKRLNHQMARGNRYAAKQLDTAGNIASGRGEEGLANQIWALAERVREQARELEAKAQGTKGDGDAGRCNPRPIV